jgi:hypothetical protein
VLARRNVPKKKTMADLLLSLFSPQSSFIATLPSFLPTEWRLLSGSFSSLLSPPFLAPFSPADLLPTSFPLLLTFLIAIYSVFERQEPSSETYASDGAHSRLTARLEDLSKQVRETLSRQGFEEDRIEVHQFLNCRYQVRIFFSLSACLTKEELS